jgi:uncharacterized protein (DUF3084 family)
LPSAPPKPTRNGRGNVGRLLREVQLESRLCDLDDTRPEERVLPARPHQTQQPTDEEIQLRKTIATLRQAIAGQREEIRDLRHQVTQLTLASAVLTQNQADTQAAVSTSGNVVPLLVGEN